jgi:hypothetical protein
LGGDLAHGGKVDVAELFDVEGSAVLCLVSVSSLVRIGVGEGKYIGKREREWAESYFVSFVVVLRIILEDLCSLIVLESTNKLLDADTRIFFPPFLAVDKPKFGQFPSLELLYSI